MKYLVILFILNGCSNYMKSEIEHSTSKFPNGLSPAIVCLEGVKYYAYSNSFAPDYNTDSTIKTCTEDKND